MPGQLRTFALQGTSGTSRIPGWQYEGDGSFSLPVVGEARRQRELWKIVGKDRKGDDDIEVQVDALVLPEPENEFDPNAMRVFIAGAVVGYLSREDAAEMAEDLLATDGQPMAVFCQARIIGGFTMRDGTIAHLGVSLDLQMPIAD